VTKCPSHPLSIDIPPHSPPVTVRPTSLDAGVSSLLLDQRRRLYDSAYSLLAPLVLLSAGSSLDSLFGILIACLASLQPRLLPTWYGSRNEISLAVPSHPVQTFRIVCYLVILLSSPWYIWYIDRIEISSDNDSPTTLLSPLIPPKLVL
jgi:hypothetical protein